MFDRTWQRDTFERAIRAFLEGFLAVIVTVQLFDLSVSTLEMAVAAGFTAACAILLSAIAGLNKKESETGAGFLVNTVPVPEKPVDPPDEEVVP